MEHFSYSLLLSLLHSIWQAALLVCLYSLMDVFIKRTNPITKRNILFLFLATQILITIGTFIIYYTGSFFFAVGYIVNNINDLLIRQRTFITIAPWMIAVYFFVVVSKTIRLAVQWKEFKFNVRSAWIKPPIDMKLFCIVKANEFGIHRKVSLWYSNAINTPLTFGFFKPIILLPFALVNNLSVTETESLIIHELSHIKSNDYFLNWLLIISETVFFFNPFIIITINRIRLEREKNCDARVLQFNYTALTYAETLLKAARFKTIPAPFFLAAAFKNSQLIKRVQFFTEKNNLRFYKRNYSIVALLPIVLMFFSGVYFVNLIKSNRIETFQKNIQQAVAENYIKDHDRFSTINLPVSKVEYPAIEINNDPIVKKKMNREDLKKNSSDKDLSRELLNESTDLTEFALPVALAEAYFNKEIILKEENSATGKSITKVYKVQLVKGKWQANLLWSINETRPMNDSLPYIRDTINFYDHVQ